MSFPRLLSSALAAAAALWVPTAAVRAQQSYVSRYSAYAGFAVIDSPVLGLQENGLHAQFGVNQKTWLALGVDYSVATGSDAITPNLLLPSLQAMIQATEAQFKAVGALPPGYSLTLRTDASTQTFGAGPQLAYRHFARVTLFAHPSFGALREHAVPRPADRFQTLLVSQLAPSGYKSDWIPTYGLGGGGEFIVSRHIAVRPQIEAVWNHPFSDLLGEGRWTFRYSIGPSFQFGRNISQRGR